MPRRLAVAVTAMLAAAWATIFSTAVDGAVRPAPATHTNRALRVCADPNNLPFSDANGSGFENRLAALLAEDLGRTLVPVFHPQRRGFVRQTLDADRCDAWMGVPAAFDRTLTTRPYYRSSYVFVTRPMRPPITSFDDARLRRMRIGIQITGEDYENPPPAQALAARGLSSQVRGYPVYGDYAQSAPQRQVIAAVARGDIDAAAVWGPLGGYFAAAARPRLQVSTIAPETFRGGTDMTFAIAIGVRRGNTALRDAIDDALLRRAHAIDALLAGYHVPRLPLSDDVTRQRR